MIVPHLDELALVGVAEDVLVLPVIGGGGDHTVLVAQVGPGLLPGQVGDVGVVPGPERLPDEVGGIREVVSLDVRLEVRLGKGEELLPPGLVIGDGVDVPGDTGLEVDHLGGDIPVSHTIDELLPGLDVGLAQNLAGNSGDHCAGVGVVGGHDHILGEHFLHLESLLRRLRHNFATVVGDDFLLVDDGFLLHLGQGLGGGDDADEVVLVIDPVPVLLQVPVDGVTDLLGMADTTGGLLGDEFGLQGSDRLADGTILLLVLEGHRTQFHQVSEGFIGDGLDSAHVSVFFCGAGDNDKIQVVFP